MRKYEYTSFQTAPLFVDEINKMDSQGWEVITIFPTSRTNVIIYLRREIKLTNDGFVEEDS